jgi:hypothetical protein
MADSIPSLIEEIHKDDLTKRLLERQNQKIYPDLFLKYYPKDCVLPKEYTKYYGYIKSMPVREDDVWVVSFIKSGELNKRKQLVRAGRKDGCICESK